MNKKIIIAIIVILLLLLLSVSIILVVVYRTKNDQKAEVRLDSKTNGEPIYNQNTNTEMPWKCYKGLPIPIRKDVNGNVQCLSKNGSVCLAGSNDTDCQMIMQNIGPIINPATCTPKDYMSANHWCYKAKNMMSI